MPTTSLLLTTAIVAAASLLSPRAWAGEGGTGNDRDGAAFDAPVSMADGSSESPNDAANCIAIGQPCAKGESCCNAAAYCGSFGGATTGQQVCGLDSPNQLSTGSCGVGGSSRDGVGASVIAGAAMAVGMSFRRRRREPRTR